jgi:DNA-binding response OmpR family regulator
VRIRVDVSNKQLTAEILELLTRAGHTVAEPGLSRRGSAAEGQRGVVERADWDLAFVGTPEAASALRREYPTAAIIVVTKIGDVAARVRALEAGADDAFDASFAPSQMMARVGSAARRAALTPPPADQITIDGATIDLSASTVTRSVTVPLTTREVEIVRWLSSRPGQVVSRAELLQHVWKVAAGSETRAVDVAIAALRGKLEREPGNPAIIVSVRGAGYRWG